MSKVDAHTSPAISVVIVTYNVAPFITFCIDSIRRSTVAKIVEVIIVDNASTDQTVQKIREEYPDIYLDTNTKNLGFSKACNQGASHAQGSYLLFLNPDCILSEGTIGKLKATFEDVPQSIDEPIGAVGPLLIDGAGQVLPESAREIPDNKSGLVKMLRLPLTSKYPYYKKLQIGSTIVSPVLTGACMMVDTEVFNKIGGFDERFFMYGEDIDLSVRLLNKGFTNKCVTTTQAIHFKGESTVKTIFKNNSNFYDAIRIYLEKHQVINRPGGLKTAVRVLSVLRFLKGLLSSISAAIFDFILIAAVIWGLQFVWGYIKANDFLYYGIFRYVDHALFYAAIWVAIMGAQGLYLLKRKEPVMAFKSSLLGSALVLIIYALLPEGMRFSRVVLLMSAFLIPFVISLRYVRRFGQLSQQSTLIGIEDNRDLLKDKLRRSNLVFAHQSDVTIPLSSRHYIFDFSKLKIEKILRLMMSDHRKVSFEFWDSKRSILYSSASRRARGHGEYLYSFYHLDQDKYLLHKRMLDLIVVMITIIPVTLIKLFLFKMDFSNIRNLIFGKITVVGYSSEIKESMTLPSIPPCLITCYRSDKTRQEKAAIAKNYAGNYTIFDDVFIISTRFLTAIKKFI